MIKTTFGEINKKIINSGKNNVDKGNAFEIFSYLWLKDNIKPTNIWYYSQFPKEKKKMMELSFNDTGIDIIMEINNKFIAVQCKFRKNRKLQDLNQLNTFTDNCYEKKFFAYNLLHNCDNIKNIKNEGYRNTCLTNNDEILININEFDRLVKIDLLTGNRKQEYILLKDNIGKLKTFVEEYKSFPTAKSLLGQVYNKLRNRYINNKLSKKEIKECEDIKGWSWEIKSYYSFSDNIKLLKDFIEKNDHLPNSRTKIGRFVQNYSQKCKNGNLTIDQENELKKYVNIKDKEECTDKFYINFNNLLDFIETYDKLPTAKSNNHLRRYMMETLKPKYKKRDVKQYYLNNINKYNILKNKLEITINKPKDKDNPYNYLEEYYNENKSYPSMNNKGIGRKFKNHFSNVITMRNKNPNLEIMFFKLTDIDNFIVNSSRIQGYFKELLMEKIIDCKPLSENSPKYKIILRMSKYDIFMNNEKFVNILNKLK
jgi:hypothetical protein